MEYKLRIAAITTLRPYIFIVSRSLVGCVVAWLLINYVSDNLLLLLSLFLYLGAVYVLIIFVRIFCSGRSLCPASALPFFSKPCRHLRMGFTSAPPSCLISLCYMNTPAKKLHYEAPSLECFRLSSPPVDLCIQFSGEADFEDFEEGEAL